MSSPLPCGACSAYAGALLPAGGVGGPPPPGRCPERGAGGRELPPPSLPLLDGDEPVRPSGVRLAPPLDALSPRPRPRSPFCDLGGVDPLPASEAVCPARCPVALP